MKFIDKLGVVIGLALVGGGIVGWHVTFSPGGTVVMGFLVIMVAMNEK